MYIYIYNLYACKFIFIQYIYINHLCIFKFCSHPSFERAIHGSVDCKDRCQQFLLNLFAQLSLPIKGWNFPLVSPIFLKRSLVFPILLFSSISFIDCWGRLFYLSLLVFGTLHSYAYIFPFLLCFSLLFFSQLFVRPPQMPILLTAFLFLGDGLDPFLLYNVTNLRP